LVGVPVAARATLTATAVVPRFKTFILKTVKVVAGTVYTVVFVAAANAD
jgi:hypothetical protein